MVSRECPICHQELEDYFANADNWDEIESWKCEYGDGGSACGHCVRICKTETTVGCEHCGAELDMMAIIRQPCGENEIVSQLHFSVEVE